MFKKKKEVDILILKMSGMRCNAWLSAGGVCGAGDCADCDL